MLHLRRGFVIPKSGGFLWNSSSTAYDNTSIFYNDNLEVFRPFNNIVKLKFDSSTSSHDSGNDHGYTVQPHGDIADILSKYGTVNGRFICDRGKTGYFNFASRDAKQDALNASLHGRISSFQMEDYVIGQPRNRYGKMRPYIHILCAAYRPSIHSASRIIRYLTKFGTSPGNELQPCPYDSDRMFMYFAYNDGRSLSHIGRKSYGYIEGNDVSRDYQKLDSQPINNVFLYPFVHHDVRKYRKDVNVLMHSTVDGFKIRKFLSDKYGDISRVDTVRESEEGTHYVVSFKDKYSVYRILYQKTHYGRVAEAMPGTHHPIFISQHKPHKAIWMQHALRIYHAPDLRDGDVFDYFDGFLNHVGCNPGLVAVARKEGSSTPIYELYFTNLWYTYDVFHRVNQWKKDNDNLVFYCAVSKTPNDGTNYYWTVKQYLV